MIQINGISNKPQSISFKQSGDTNISSRNNSQKRLLSTENRSIGFVEGTELFLSGILKQGREILSSVIKHPLKTASLVAGTTIGLMALPLIGIPSAVGGGVLAIGFTGLALANATKHALQFAGNNKKGTYDIARLNLQQIGEDSLNLALSSPFVPKGVSHIKNFTKYGKFGINKTLLNELKSPSSLIDKFKSVLNADREMTRNYNFRSAVDKEIATLKDLTESQKLQIKNELLEFNIEFRKIPDLVLDKYAQAKGVSTKPDIKYVTMAPNTHGAAVANNCTIYLNTYKPYLGKPAFSDYQAIKHVQVGDKYAITYVNKSTGATIVENIDVNIYDSYVKLWELNKKLSPEAKKILTILHEREHIHQFAQVCNMKGFDWMRGNISTRGKELYEKMFVDLPKVKLCSPEAIRIETYTLEAVNGTPAAYIKRPIEIEARNFEVQALSHPAFVSLDNVFKTVKTSTNPSCVENVMLNDLRIESSKV